MRARAFSASRPSQPLQVVRQRRRRRPRPRSSGRTARRSRCGADRRRSKAGWRAIESQAQARRRIGGTRRRLAGRLRGPPGDRSRRRARLSRAAAGRSASARSTRRAVATIVTASRDPVRLDQPDRRISSARPDASRRRAGRGLVGRVPARVGLDRLDPPRRHAVAAARRPATSGRWRGSRPARSTPRWPKRCACRARAMRGQWVRRGPPLHRRPPRARRNRVRGAARRPAPPLTSPPGTLRAWQATRRFANLCSPQASVQQLRTKALARLSNFGGGS